MKLKIALRSVILGIVLLLVFCSVTAICFREQKEIENKTSIEESVEFLNDKYPIDLMVYGETVDFPTDLHYRTVDSIGQILATEAKECNYKVLIINDLHGSVSLA